MARLAMAVLWPSFLAAIAAEGIFFSLCDPHELSMAGGHLDLPPLAIYTLGFFFFWFFCAMASMLTAFLLRPPNKVSRPL